MKTFISISKVCFSLQQQGRFGVPYYLTVHLFKFMITEFNSHKQNTDFVIWINLTFENHMLLYSDLENCVSLKSCHLLADTSFHFS